MIAGIIQARMGSTRLPGKILKEVNGIPLLVYLIQRVGFCSSLDTCIVATSENSENDILEQYATQYDFPLFRGSENNVLQRYIDAAKAFNVDTVVRITGDNPLTFPDAIDAAVKFHTEKNADYTSTSGLPLGTGIEVVQRTTLESLLEIPLEPYHKEHVTLYIREHSQKFSTENVSFPYAHPQIRLTVDEIKDFNVVHKIIKMLHKNGDYISMDEVFSLQRTCPEIFLENSNVVQKNK